MQDWTFLHKNKKTRECISNTAAAKSGQLDPDLLYKIRQQKGLLFFAEHNLVDTKGVFVPAR